MQVQEFQPVSTQTECRWAHQAAAVVHPQSAALLVQAVLVGSRVAVAAAVAHRKTASTLAQVARAVRDSWW